MQSILFCVVFFFWWGKVEVFSILLAECRSLGKFSLKVRQIVHVIGELKADAELLFGFNQKRIPNPIHLLPWPN